MKKEMSIKKLLEDLKPFIEDQIEQDDDLVILEALKTCDYDNELLQDVIQSAGDLASVINNYLEDLTIEDIVRIMENHTKFSNMDNSLYPSGWPSESLGAYPGKLAEALVKTRDSESLTDIFNIFYAQRDLSKEAVDVFMKDAIEDPMGQTKQIISSCQADDEDLLVDMLEEISQKYPQFIEQMKHRFNL